MLRGAFHAVAAVGLGAIKSAIGSAHEFFSLGKLGASHVLCSQSDADSHRNGPTSVSTGLSET